MSEYLHGSPFPFLLSLPRHLLHCTLKEGENVGGGRREKVHKVRKVRAADGGLVVVGCEACWVMSSQTALRSSFLVISVLFPPQAISCPLFL